LKVSDLIKKLKKLPQDAEVVWRDHDHSYSEFNSIVHEAREVEELEPVLGLGRPVVSLSGI